MMAALTPRQIAGLAGDYSNSNLYHSVPASPSPITNGNKHMPSMATAYKSVRSSTMINRTDLSGKLVLPLTPPTSDLENTPLMRKRDVVLPTTQSIRPEQPVSNSQSASTKSTTAQAKQIACSAEQETWTDQPSTTELKSHSHKNKPIRRKRMQLMSVAQIRAIKDLTNALKEVAGMQQGLVRPERTVDTKEKVDNKKNNQKETRPEEEEEKIKRKDMIDSEINTEKDTETKEIDEVELMLMSHLKSLIPSSSSPSISPSAEIVKPEVELAPSPSPSPVPVLIEKPLFLRRPPTPTIRYPRGYIPPTPLFSPETEKQEVQVEFKRSKSRNVKVMELMTEKMRRVFEGEAWVRRLDEEVTTANDEEETEGVQIEGVRGEVERYLNEGKGGRVQWDEGVGKLIRSLETGEGEEGDVYLFLDHSNIHHGMIDTLVSHPLPNLSRNTKKILNIPIMSLLMTRGRRIAKDGMHLVASSPLDQSLDTAVKLGWRCCVLKRVAVDSITSSESEGERVGKKAGKNSRKSLVIPQPSASETDEATRTTDAEEIELPNLNDPSITSRRMREQAVDELLHLQILQTLLWAPRAGTLILGTGDAKGGQFNDLGFLGCVKMAVEKGWKVELWSWKKGMSRMWREEAKRMGWSRRQFRIWDFDEWVEEVVMERERSGKKARRG